jgi:hypothetical protein
MDSRFRGNDRKKAGMTKNIRGNDGASPFDRLRVSGVKDTDCIVPISSGLAMTG